jgi:peptidoglycan hydrolase-like protein with peptidoglycan-binding domain
MTVATAGSASASTTVANVDRNHTTKAKTTCIQQAVNIRFPLSIDGVWGDKTTAGVKKYQAAFHYTQDGIVGKVTGGAMMSDIAVFDAKHGTHYASGCYAIIPTNW